MIQLTPHRIDAFWLGTAYQRALDAPAEPQATTRRSRGIFYTPQPLVEHLLTQTLDPGFCRACPQPPRILDPACGCGGFLIAAARALRAARPEWSPRAIANHLHGTDIDPLAVTLCRLALWLELGDPADDPADFAQNIRTADALLDPPPPGSFDLILTNPPFLSQLAAKTARSRDATSQLRKRFGDSVRPYTDPAALFLHLAIDAVGPGGRVGIVLPDSVLASRDAAPARAHAERRASIRSIWVDRDGAFDASVRAVAIAFGRRPAAPQPIRRFLGNAFEPCRPREATAAGDDQWGALAADLFGVPIVRLAGHQTLGDLCEITAGFRDEYYAVAQNLLEAPDPTDDHGQPDNLRPVATVGMIDPASLAWGQGPERIAKRIWARPCVTAPAADPVLQGLLTRQAHPKLLIATQTRILEPAADEHGRFLALTPVITIIPRDPADLWRIGALLASPAASAWLAARCFGTARSLDAIKPSAAILRELPTPTLDAAWDTAADSFRLACHATDPATRRQSLTDAARASAPLLGIHPESAAELLAWWQARLTPRTRRPAIHSAGESPP